MAQFILSVAYFKYALAPDSEDSIILKVIGAISIVLLCLALRIEALQILSLESKLDYFKDAYNWFDLTGLIFSFLVLILTIFGLEWI